MLKSNYRENNLTEHCLNNLLELSLTLSTLSIVKTHIHAIGECSPNAASGGNEYDITFGLLFPFVDLYFDATCLWHRSIGADAEAAVWTNRRSESRDVRRAVVGAKPGTDGGLFRHRPITTNGDQ